MRQAIPIALLAAWVSAASAQEQVYLPDGTPATQSIGAPPKRTQVAAGEPVFVLDRIQDATPALTPVEPPPPPDLDEPVTLEEAGAAREEKVLPREGGTSVEPDVPKPITSNEPLPEKQRPTDDLAPAVSIRTEGDIAIEEYRRNGQVYMIVVTPKDGVRYTYLDTDGDGRLEGDPNDGPVQPVYFTVYEWE